jgi:L-alanine-DL-glutamate epimerase-like enolase superfamily enzyme
MLLKDWEHGCRQIIFPEVIGDKGFSVPTNGLIWMASKEEMKEQIMQKLKSGFTSIKLKIGAIDFTNELELLQFIRQQFSKNEVEIRVDANGAFGFEEAKEKLKRMAEYDVSYIEQPIKAGQWQEMAALCETTPVKIALDEELIGIVSPEHKKKLIETVRPQLLVLKPALIGGFTGTDIWKNLILSNGGSWVITSALESNIGLNAIAQYTAKGWSEYAQGLGTGQLFANNIPSPYSVDAQGLHFHKNKNWDFSALL